MKEENPTFLIASPYESLFSNYALTDLMTVAANGKKKQISKNYSVYLSTCELLKHYGVFMDGITWLYNTKGNQRDTCVYHISITTDFSLENEFLFQQMYGYEESEVDIGLDIEHRDDCAYSFSYEIDSGRCLFKRNHYGSVPNKCGFDNLSLMLQAIKNSKKNLLLQSL